jgi:uncharacterized membrane protein YdjX (TVP38/TMEM64 family)
MKPATTKDRVRLIVASSGLLILVIGTAWLVYSGTFVWCCSELVKLFENREHLRRYINSWGGRAPLAFIGLQALQVVIAPIPGEVTGIVGGFLFGTFRNVVYSTIGLTAGSAVAFLTARLIGQPFVNLVISRRTFEKFEHFTQEKGAVTILIMFMIPGFPKDILSYILGLSPMRFVTFCIVCGLGRIPGTLLLSLSGSALYGENWWMLIVVSAICLALVVFFTWKRESAARWFGLHGHADDPD